MNTYGLFSINIGTFNQHFGGGPTYPKAGRDQVVTFFKIHNLTLNILGYIPGVSTFSGCVRIVTGLAIVGITLAVGDRNAQKGIIIGDWYKEALLTGITQIARGALEAFVPFGWAVNIPLDILASCSNIITELEAFSGMPFDMGLVRPHPNPEYSFPFWLLNLA